MRPQNAMIDMLHTRICVLNTWYFPGKHWIGWKMVVIRVWWLVVSPSKNLVHLGSLLLTVYPKKLLNPGSIFRLSKYGILLLHWLNVDHSHLPEKFKPRLRWSDDPRLPGFFLCEMVSSCHQKQSSISGLAPACCHFNRGTSAGNKKVIICAVG